MAFFAVHYTYVTDAAAVDAARPQHRAYLGSLAERGVLRASGPLVDTDPGRALLIFEATSGDAVIELLAGDPFQQGQLVADTAIAQWKPVIGDYADRA